ncbi:UDP-N-acetylglucosamine 1-carboxyvinyltransferase [Actinopolymorpha singaporensis]|uniref:UDP-N-acetylglucosamine 1-carboxyvinyltransferase n=1 Tax=Actinopolymorpha singaporensis TaxID=117157 RepID=A0A1H1YJV7_9ACTN|nr:UDP-N-acetylglucosamine 1-carboxyvinyltransferase [Actinopolymorpha singaporensis]SDT21336.1 UDP-N-acetylglucosamine 1-carboxyvinyltransferase [Actinopolymorpha singaporensis]
MERLRIRGGNRLEGEVPVSGAKNSALKLMAASLLTQGRTVLHNVPDILDVKFMGALLKRMGCELDTSMFDSGTLTIDVPESIHHEADYDLVRRLRASITVLGPLVARCGRAKVALPGGDSIGSRGLGMHVSGLERMGAQIGVEHGFVVAEAPAGLHGASILLDFPSVGATENLLLAATLAHGTTLIDNAAREPEIVDIADMLTKMGAKIGGIGTPTLEVEGPADLSAVEHTVVPDRMVAGTWAIGAVVTGGEVTLRDARADHLDIVLDKLTRAGASVRTGPVSFTVSMEGRPRAVNVVTLPYPGFPTDLQAMMVALAAISEGTSMVTENLFDGRFRFVQELARLGADVRTDGHHAVIRGRPALSGAPVEATDIRAGAGLLLAGLVAEGETLVSGVHHLDRGYPRLVEVLQGLGADVQREPDNVDFG